MNFGSNNSLDLAALREQQERDALIAEATEAVRAHGTGTCVECQSMIPEARRIAAPFAVRCVDCQRLLEAEKYHK
ncbi:MAG: molecular chaperone DnaK [Stutzerimonas stutzeri]|nr:MAG: molecular chaperone DnaK [Stutzerimonas stutzeri]